MRFSSWCNLMVAQAPAAQPPVPRIGISDLVPSQVFTGQTIAFWQLSDHVWEHVSLKFDVVSICVFFPVPGTYVGSNILKNLEKLQSRFFFKSLFVEKMHFYCLTFCQTILNYSEFLSDSLVRWSGSVFFFFNFFHEKK